MEARLAGLVWTGVGLMVILALTGFLLLRRAWLMATSGVLLALALGMLAATRYQLWALPGLPGQLLLVVALVMLVVAVLRSRHRGKPARGQA